MAGVRNFLFGCDKYVEIGVEIGRHIGKGYTAFTLDVGPALRLGEVNQLAVRVDNNFVETMLPRGKSSDWAHDGGIYRPVNVLVTAEDLAVPVLELAHGHVPKALNLFC